MQVVISYIDQLDTTADRRSQLERCYYFTCQCESCLDTDNVGVSSAEKLCYNVYV